jgi:hypothetical protein
LKSFAQIRDILEGDWCKDINDLTVAYFKRKFYLNFLISEENDFFHKKPPRS